MRQRNWRLIIVGLVLLAVAVGFFLFAQADMAPKSNDPVTMMRTVGQVSGGVGGISIVMIIFGLIGRKA
ncbi:MAG TPA: hypothetical protein VKB71_14560 [Rhizomicrobium sp.]|nr:hypothetical protein [Rhizomicrobium sp.]